MMAECHMYGGETSNSAVYSSGVRMHAFITWEMMAAKRTPIIDFQWADSQHIRG